MGTFLPWIAPQPSSIELCAHHQININFGHPNKPKICAYVKLKFNINVPKEHKFVDISALA